MKYQVFLNRRNLIVEANSEKEAAKQVSEKLHRGEKIYRIKKVESSESKDNSWWEVWLD